MKFSHTFIVKKEYLDEQNHVNNVSFVQWVQDVAVAHWLNQTTAEQQKSYSWVMLRHEIDYKRQAFEMDEITAVTWVGEWSKVTCERFVEIYREADLLVKSRTVWCLLAKKTLKPTRISEDIKKLF
jgi:acyl-CoA thioester hydrolase